MGGKMKFSLDFFPSFQNKDEYFEKLIDTTNAKRNIFHHFLFLIGILYLYGMVMGSYNSLLQATSSGAKMPMLFGLVLLICFPAFFMIQYVLGSKLRLTQMISMILAGYVLTASIMLSFSPIVIFFMITGNNYHFLKLLHVCIFIFSGLFGMKVIIEAMQYACEKKAVYPKIGVKIFRIWILIMAFVGMQLSWTLRPFLGNKQDPFELFRTRQGNFYQAVIQSMVYMFFPRAEQMENQKIGSQETEINTPQDKK